MTLSDIEARVLGALIEKDMATPEYYPLTFNALVNACNQKSNRHPVVNYHSDKVARAIERLRGERLAAVLTGRGHRVPKYRHWAWETLALDRREMAVLCVLLLRGPQTPGEIKERAQRMFVFDDLASVESCLGRLIGHEPSPFAAELPRRPGTRETRYVHLLCGEPPAEEMPEADGALVFREGPETRPARAASAGDARLASLEARVAELENQLSALRDELAGFRSQFE